MNIAASNDKTYADLTADDPNLHAGEDNLAQIRTTFEPLFPPDAETVLPDEQTESAQPVEETASIKSSTEDEVESFGRSIMYSTLD